MTQAADVMYIFQQSEPADLDFIARSISKAVAKRVPTLGPHDFIEYDRRGPQPVVRHIDGNGRPVATLNAFSAAADRP